MPLADARSAHLCEELAGAPETPRRRELHESLDFARIALPVPIAPPIRASLQSVAISCQSADLCGRAGNPKTCRNMFPASSGGFVWVCSECSETCSDALERLKSLYNSR